jgi:hypothetical protein
MDNVKTFEKFINELNAGTYDQMIKYGTERGDLKGQRIAKTATELKTKNSSETIIDLFTPSGEFYIKFNIDVQNIRVTSARPIADTVVFIDGADSNNTPSKLEVWLKNSNDKLYELFLRYNNDAKQPVILNQKGVKIITNLIGSKWSNFQNQKIPAI